MNASAPTSSGENIHYHWSYDAAYYSAVVERYYRQLPFVLHLPVQYTLLWLGITVVRLVQIGAPTVEFIGGALLIGILLVPGLVVLTKKGIMLKYRMRSSFGTDADFFLSESGITIQQKSLNGTWPWRTYTGAVRFSDGILLLKPGAIRWLPDSALRHGTVDEAISLVRSRLSIRQLS